MLPNVVAAHMVYNEATTRTLGATSVVSNTVNVAPQLEAAAVAREPMALGGVPDVWPHGDTARVLEAGEVFNRYRLEERLGLGGMGAVFRARDDLLQRLVALKVIHPDYSRRDPAAGLRFLREAEIVAALSHPHIIRLLDAGIDAETAFMTFEFVEGESLAQRLRTSGAMSPEDAVAVMLPVASAMVYAHARGVVHGDLKPTNILLGSDYMGRICPKVLDFGVSFFASVDPRLDPTRSRVAGTPGYLAPECLTQTDVDARLDCFSLGCVLYECLTGHGPFAHCKRLSEAALAAHNGDYVPPSLLRPLPPGIDEAIARALAPQPSDRYESVRALARDLLDYATPTLRALWEGEFSEAG